MGRGELAGLHILIVEDYYALAESLSLLLEQEGCVIAGPAPTVEAALEVVNSTRIDGAILDVNLRGRSVAPVARRLRELGRPLLFLTGHTEVGRLVEEFSDCPWISKPAEEGDLLAALRKVTLRA